MFGLVALLSSAAFAHLPHDTVTAVAAPVPFTRGEPLVAVLDNGDRLPDLLVSRDAGRTWDTLGGEPLTSPLTDAAWVNGRGVALEATGWLWWSTDLETWTELALPARTNDLGGGQRLVVATDDGIVGIDPDAGTRTVELPGVAVLRLFEGRGGLVAADENGQIWLDGGGSWTSMVGPRPALVPLAAVWAPGSAGELWVGYEDGSAWRWDGGSWAQCGAVPGANSDGSHNELVRLASDGVTVLADRASRGPARSFDGCRTWVQAAPEHQRIDWPEGGSGSFTDTEHAFVFLDVDGDAWLSVGYDGSWSTLAGALERAIVRGPDYTRAITFSRDFARDGRLLLGTYGAGVTRSSAFGVRFDAPGLGVEDTNVMSVAIPWEAEADELAYAVFNHDSLWRSEDGGASWADVSGDLQKIEHVVAGPGRLWALGATVPSFLPQLANRLGLSLDGAAGWSSVAGLPAELGDDEVMGLVDTPTRTVLWTDGAVASSRDGLATWSLDFTATVGSVEAAALWPADRPTLLFVADDAGIWRDGPRGWQLVWTPERGAVTLLGVADDDTLVAVTTGGRVAWSRDAGEHWEDLAVVVPTQPLALGLRPDFADHPEVLVGGVGGVFKVGREGLERWLTWERTDDRSGFFECDACRERGAAGAGLGKVLDVPPLATVALWAWGGRGRMLGQVEAPTVVDVRVDGALLQTRELEAGDMGQSIAALKLGTEGWHRVELTVVGDEGIALDGFEAWAFPHPLGHDEPDVGIAGQGAFGPETTWDTGAFDVDPGGFGGVGDSGAPAAGPPVACGCASAAGSGASGAGGTGAAGLGGLVVAGLLLARRRG